MKCQVCGSKQNVSTLMTPKLRGYPPHKGNFCSHCYDRLLRIAKEEKR